MSAVLPGKPESRLQGLAIGYWEQKHINVYISGKAISILNDTQAVLQTIYDDDDDPLDAVCIDEWTGKIATCTNRQVRVYKPSGLAENALKWILDVSFDIPKIDSQYSYSLDWGCTEELLVASKQLTLYATKGQLARLWDKELSNAVKSATISYDSAYIASVGTYDRVPKIWRCLTYGQDQVRFDFTCLRHPEIVTSMRWRKPFHLEQAAENVLYTICLDYTVRIWIPTESSERQHWQLWGKVDVATPLPNGLDPPHIRFVFIIDGRDFTASVEKAVEARLKDDDTTDDVALDHLVAIANRNPEICVAIDAEGLLYAWAFEDVRSSTASASSIFSIAQVHSKQLETFEGFISSRGESAPHVEIKTYCNRKSGVLQMLFHTFDGRIGVFAASVADLFDPTTNDQRVSLKTIWSGHSSPVQKIVRNFSGRTVVSRGECGESIVWRHDVGKQGKPTYGLTRQSIIPGKERIYKMAVLRKGQFVMVLQRNSIALWDCRQPLARLLAEKGYDISGARLCLINLPRPSIEDSASAYIATITSEGKGIVWEVQLPEHSQGAMAPSRALMDEFCLFDLSIAELSYVLPVDPAGSSPTPSGFWDVFARDVAISYTRTGGVYFWTARVDLGKRKVDWLSTCYTETGLVDAALVSGSTLKKAAIVGVARSQVTIWDIGSSRLEHDVSYTEHNAIQDLDWTSTPDSQSILAIGFQFKVVLLTQMRFDYLNKGPAWAQIREISTRELTPHPIGDSAWLGDGHLVIGAGNQMFIYDRQLTSTGIPAEHVMRLLREKDGTLDMFGVVQRFNGPLSLFHPQFLSQCILAGKRDLVSRILLELNKALKYHVGGETIDDYLEMDLAEVYSHQKTRQPKLEERTNAYINGANHVYGSEDKERFSEETAKQICDQLLKHSILQLSGHEQIQLANIVQCLGLVERHRRSIDENGARFMLFFRQNALRRGRANHNQLSWREINWAFHSNSQDILIDFIAKQSHGEILWTRARESGVFMWLSDATAIKAQFEVIARNEYKQGDDKNPVNCSLFYLALRKKAVLQGLWRMATGNKEQAATQKLLAHDFSDPKWKTVALKNAYALLSKRRFEYAAAFFLLADNLEGAVEVCLRQMRDMQLAIAIARIYEGPNGPVLKKILHEEVLTIAAQEGNRWLASWAFWMLGRRDMAVRALITPVYALVETPRSPDYKSRLFLTDDPALIVLYQQLRHQTLQTLRGASKIKPQTEWEFVLHNAKLYDRMGCDLIGLDLVRNWEFQPHAAPGLGGEVNPLQLLRSRSSLVVDDIFESRPDTRQILVREEKDLVKIDKNDEVQKDDKKDGTDKKEPTVFVEPEASSLLDAFGL